ncbi:MAG TPA: hypothetical protein VNW68_06395 [Candidatus Limnocylindria bacterium]|nr:hypothetical protein [Candidatus Limnocylindria bacterium]
MPSIQPGSTPPLAELRVSDGESHPGRQGSYCYAESCADTPFLPARVLPVVELPRGATIELAMPAGHGFIHWSAQLADADDEQGTYSREFARGGEAWNADDDPPPPPPMLESVELPPLPSGSWVLLASVGFLPYGDASYFWHVVVP